MEQTTLSRRDLGDEAATEGISDNTAHGVDPAIRSAVVDKLSKARSFADGGQEEAKLHKLVCSWHENLNIQPWQLALQYERVMEKHIDMIYAKKRRATNPAQTAKRVLKKYWKYIHFGIASPSVPCGCKRVLRDIVNVLEKDSGLTMIGVRRVEHSLKLLKLKIDQRCEDLQRISRPDHSTSASRNTATGIHCEKKRKKTICILGEATKKTCREKVQVEEHTHLKSRSPPIYPPLLPLRVHTDTPLSSSTNITPTTKSSGTVNLQFQSRLKSHLHTPALNTSPSQRLVKDSSIIGSPAAVRIVFQMKP